MVLSKYSRYNGKILQLGRTNPPQKKHSEQVNDSGISPKVKTDHKLSTT